MSTYPNFKFHHYLDPAPTLTDLSDRMSEYEFSNREIAIMGTKRTYSDPMQRVGERIGLNATSGRALTTSGTNGWFVDANGDHVIGQLSLIPGSNPNTPAILAAKDDVWILGEIYRRHYNVDDSQNGWSISPFGSSDGKSTPHVLSGNRTSRIKVSKAFRPAPWALELFPRFTDSEEVVQLKLQLAERNWNMRRAQYALHVQATYRQWGSMLPELDEAGFALPSVRAGFLVQGDALVRTSPPEEVQRAIREVDVNTVDADRRELFRNRGGVPSDRLETFTRVGFTLAIPVDTAEATEVPARDVNYQFTNRFGEESASMSNIRQTRFVNGLAPHSTL